MGRISLYGRRSLGRPMTWSTNERRVFILTLPVSVPLWILVLFGAEIRRGLKQACRPLVSFWSGPPQRPRRSSYWSYGHKTLRLTHQDAKPADREKLDLDVPIYSSAKQASGAGIIHLECNPEKQSLQNR